MIVAVLKPSEYEGRQRLTGVLRNLDAVKDGSMVVLLKMPDDSYHLRAITGFNRPSKVDPQMYLSFLPEEND